MPAGLVNSLITSGASLVLPLGEVACHTWAHTPTRFTLELGHPSGRWPLGCCQARGISCSEVESLGTEFPEKLSRVKLSFVYF